MFGALLGAGGGGLSSSVQDTGSATSGNVTLPNTFGGIQFGLTGKQQTHMVYALAAAGVVIALLLLARRR